MPTQLTTRPRILIVDDNPEIRADFAKVLGRAASTDEFAATESSFFGDAEPEAASARPVEFLIDFASQGSEGFEMVVQARPTPYSVAFVDMRMPPGWDGLQTIQRMLQEDAALQIVLCTAHSDYSMDEVRRRIGPTDRLLLLKKPFDPAEVQQLALSLSAKWEMQAEVRRHVEELEHVSSELRESLATITAEAGRRTEAERRLEQQLTHDGVTGLPNRLGITRRIDVCLRRDVDAVRGADARATGVAFVVLEDLRRVREALGHDTADDAARLVTSRLKAMAAQPEVAAVCTSAELGRAGEDEFVIVLASLDGADAGLRLADRFLEQLAQPIQVRGRQLALRPCLGLAAGRLQYERGSELLRDASTAADAARTKGGPSRVVFEPRMHLVARSRLELESNLRRAVEERQFHHLYQVVRALDGRLLGIAGGLRWENPQADAPEPRTFLPVVEACGLAPRFGTLALEQLLLDTATWSAPRGKTATFELELPAGPREIGDEGYARALVEAGETLAGHGFALAVRVEEAQLARSGFACEERLAALRASGVRVNLELATDVVSLALVQRMRPDGLRLPRELVARLHDDADTLAMVESLVACAHRLGVRVTAAGVDGARALELARQLGVDAVLGLHDGPPSSAAMVRARISGAPADGARA